MTGGYTRYVRLALKKLEKQGTEVLYEYSPQNPRFLPVTAVTSTCTDKLSVLFRVDPGVSAWNKATVPQPGASALPILHPT